MKGRRRFWHRNCPDCARKRTSPAELVRLAGSLERISLVTKTELLDHFLRTARELAIKKQHSAPYLAALGLLLNRSPLYAGPEFVMPAVHVEKAYDALSDLDWTDPYLVEIQTLFLRAGRIVNDPKIDLPKSLREKIASKLQKAGVSPSKACKTPLVTSRSLSLTAPISSANPCHPVW